jgi:hypothetical protein
MRQIGDPSGDPPVNRVTRYPTGGIMGIAARREQAITAIEAAFKTGGTNSTPGFSATSPETETESSAAEQAIHPRSLEAADRDALGRWAVGTCMGSGQSEYVPYKIRTAGERVGIAQTPGESPPRYAARVCAFLNGEDPPTSSGAADAIEHLAQVAHGE